MVRQHLDDGRGFTFIELVMVIVMIGFLAAIAVQKMINLTREAEMTAEDTTIEILRSNLLNNMGEQLMKGADASFPENPFANLNKIPQGYRALRKTPPTGLEKDHDLWVYVKSDGNDTLTPEEAGTTLKSFNVNGFIYHQRRNNSVVRWAYDSSSGAISSKFLVPKKDLNQSLSRMKLSKKKTKEDPATTP